MFQGLSLLQIIFLVLRAFQIGFAATMAIIAALSTHPSTSIGQSPSIHVLFFAIATATLCLIPVLLYFLNKVHLLTDGVIALLWLISFGIFLQFFSTLSCGSAWNWETIARGGQCGRWTAVLAVTFLSAIFWVITAVSGFFIGGKASKKFGIESKWWKPMNFK